MVRMATALLTLVCILAAPTISITCMVRCEAISANQPPVCHEGTHAKLEPGADHRGHVHHALMADQNAKKSIGGQHAQQHRHLNSSTCRNAVCSSVTPSRPARAILSLRRTAAPAYMPQTAFFYSPPPSGSEGHTLRHALDRLPLSASVPLRI